MQDYVAARAGAHVRTVSIPFPIEDPEIVVENVAWGSHSEHRSPSLTTLRVRLGW